MRFQHLNLDFAAPLAAVLGLLAIIPAASQAQGKIIVGNDDDTLSDPGYANASSTGAFALNVASFFGAKTGSNLLAYSNNLGLTGNSLAATMTGAGYNWTVSTSTTFTLANLENYKAIFLGGYAVPSTSILTQYVQAGGDVYLYGGSAAVGDGTATGEAAAWNPFLNVFGLSMIGTAYNSYIGDVPISAPASDPLFTGVSSLYYYRSSDVALTGASSPVTYIDYTYGGDSLQAVYNPATAGAAAPEPGAFPLVALGGLPVVGMIRRNRRQKSK